MRLLFDQNLSRHLVTILADEFPNSQHVFELGLAASTDKEGWDFARQHGFTIA